MKRKRKIFKGEGVLLCLTALFLCVLMVLYHRDLDSASAPMSMETERGGRQEVPPELPTPEPAAPEVLDLNEASAEEFAALPGIGPVLAERIIAYRDANGPFDSVEDLLNVSGIGEKKLSSLEGLIKVSGSPSLAAG